MKIDNNVLSLLLIFLGSLLTFGSSYLVEHLKNQREWSQKKENFLIYIELELKALENALEKLKNNLEAKKFYDLLIVNRIDQTVSNLELSKKEAYYLENYPLQEKIINILSDTTIFLNDLRGLENFSSAEQKKLKDDIQTRGFVEDKPKFKNYQTSIFKEFKELEDFFSTRRTEKLIELIDIKRRVEDLIKEL